MAIVAETPIDDLYALNGALIKAQKAVELYMQVENPGILAGANTEVQALVDGALTDLGFVGAEGGGEGGEE